MTKEFFDLHVMGGSISIMHSVQLKDNPEHHIDLEAPQLIRLDYQEMEDLIKQILKQKDHMKFIRKPVNKLENFFGHLEMNPKEKCKILDDKHGPDACAYFDNDYCKAHDEPCSVKICYCTKDRFA